LEALNFGIGQIRELTQSIGIKGDELEKGWREQQNEHWKRLDAEKEHWEKATLAMDTEMGKLREEYEKVKNGLKSKKELYEKIEILVILVETFKNGI
jgi:hypothetical protein